MKYVRLKTNDPYYNLAVEEYLLRQSEDDYFMLWQNAPSVIIGKNQNAYTEVELDYARSAGINVVRRITGGGAVYHDGGNLNFSFITSTAKADALDFDYFTRPIISALAEMGLECTLSGRNDLEIGGRKFSGNAQYSDGRRILHHGTLLFNTDLDVLEKALRTDKEKLEFKAVKSHKGRVVNLSELLNEKWTVSDFADRIEWHLIKKTGVVKVDVPADPAIDELRARNASEEWIYSSRRYLTDYTLCRRKKYPFGIVEVKLKLSGDVIENAVISGDFFGKEPVGELENKLSGKKTAEISYLDVSKYVDKMTDKEFWALINL